MAIDFAGMRDRKAAQVQQMQQQQQVFQQQQEAIKQKRTSDFYRALQAEFVDLLDKSTAKVTYANGKLSYSPGMDGTSKNDLWNKFKSIANNKNIPIDSQTFDSLYNEFQSARNAKWRESFDYATVSGAKPEDVHALFRENETFRKDFMDIEATGFDTSTEQGVMDRNDFSTTYRPSGSYMRHGDTFMGMGAVPEWIGDNPWTTTGIGAGVAGAGFMARNPIKNLFSKIGGGGAGTLAAFAGPAALGMLGAPKGVQDTGRAAADAYFIGQAVKDIKGSGGLNAYKNLGKQQINKSIVTSNMDDLVKTAKDLNVKVAKKATEESLRKKLIKKVSGQTYSKTSQALASGASKSIWKRLFAIGGKAAARQAGGSVAPGIGNLLMAGWSAYDLVNLGIDVFSGGDSTPTSSGLTLDADEAAEYRKIMRGEY